MKRKSIFAKNKDDRIMNEIMKIDTIQQYNDYFGVETLHPLVSVIEGSRGKPLYYCRKLYNVYAILLKDTICGQLKYGQSAYDYQRGAMLFIAPGQVMGRMDTGLPSGAFAGNAAGPYDERILLFFI